MDRLMTQFDDLVVATDGLAYIARAWGREDADGQWKGWIEFEPRDGGPLLRAPAEVELEARTDFERWAFSLAATDLEVALEQARDRQVNGGAEEPGGGATTADPVRGRTGVDPFAAYAAGEAALRQVLAAAEERQLQAVIRGHHWVDERQIDLERVGRFVLEEMIVAAVRRQTASREAA